MCTIRRSITIPVLKWKNRGILVGIIWLMRLEGNSKKTNHNHTKSTATTHPTTTSPFQHPARRPHSGLNGSLSEKATKTKTKFNLETVAYVAFSITWMIQLTTTRMGKVAIIEIIRVFRHRRSRNTRRRYSTKNYTFSAAMMARKITVISECLIPSEIAGLDK